MKLPSWYYLPGFPSYIMSFDSLPDEVLPVIFANVSPGALLKLSLVSEISYRGTSEKE